MGQSTPFVFDDPINKEIRRVIQRHFMSGHILAVAEVAADILQTLPGTGLDAEHLANQIMITAASAGVPVMIGPPHSGGVSDLPAH